MAALALAALSTTTAGAIEVSGDVAPEIVTPDQVVTRESADRVMDGPGKSSAEIAADRALGGLPEVGAGDDIGPMRCDNPVKQWVQVSGKTNYHVPSRWAGTSYKDGPGGSMKVSVTKSGEIGVEVGGTVDVSTSVLVA
ncbi:hypothetical protein [Streptomyces sp. NPDC001274]